MDWLRECAVVIPCRDEAGSIGPLVRAVREHLPAVIIVDDGSRDGTGAEAAAAGAEVIAHERSLGKGASLRAGWRQASARGFAWTISMDGDGQHAPADIPKFLRCAEHTGASLVVGDRSHDFGRMPLVRRLVNRWMTQRLSRCAGFAWPDSQCGFRLMQLEALARCPLVSEHFEIESEQLLAFAARGERIEFVPIQVIYRTERSKIRPLRDTLRWFRWRRRWREQASSARAK